MKQYFKRSTAGLLCLALLMGLLAGVPGVLTKANAEEATGTATTQEAPSSIVANFDTEGLDWSALQLQGWDTSSDQIGIPTIVEKDGNKVLTAVNTDLTGSRFIYSPYIALGDAEKLYFSAEGMKSSGKIYAYVRYYDENKDAITYKNASNKPTNLQSSANKTSDGEWVTLNFECDFKGLAETYKDSGITGTPAYARIMLQMEKPGTDGATTEYYWDNISLTADHTAHAFNEASDLVQTAGNCETPTVYWGKCACGAVSHVETVEGAAPDHIYDNDADTTCNACGAVREVEEVVANFDAEGLDWSALQLQGWDTSSEEIGIPTIVEKDGNKVLTAVNTNLTGSRLIYSHYIALGDAEKLYFSAEGMKSSGKIYVFVRYFDADKKPITYKNASNKTTNLQSSANKTSDGEWVTLNFESNFKEMAETYKDSITGTPVYARILLQMEKPSSVVVDFYWDNISLATDHTAHAFTEASDLVQTAGNCETATIYWGKCACGAVSHVETVEVAAPGHTYDNDSDPDCNVCGETREVESKITFSTNVVVGNNLDMLFGFDKTAVADWKGYTVKLTRKYADGTADVVKTYAFAQWSQDTENGKYYVTYDGLAFFHMGDKITVEILDASGKVVSEAWTDSVEAYALRRFAEAGASTELKAVLVEMLYFGAAAQEKFEYDTGNLVTADLTADHIAARPTPEAFTNNLTQGEKFNKSNLVVKSHIEFLVAFDGLTTDMSAKVEFTKWDGTGVTKEIAGSEFGRNGDYIFVTMPEELSAADARQTITITIYSGETEYAICQESIEAYLARQNETNGVFAAFMKYADAAKAYLSK